MSTGLLGGGDGGKFYDGEDRLNFVRKVYSILGVQILITSLVTMIPLMSDSAALWMQINYGWLIAAMVGSIVLSCAMICVQKLTR